MHTFIQLTGMLILTASAVWDILYRKLPVWILSGILILAVVCRLIVAEVPLAEILGGAAVGIVFLGISRITREAFGYADSLLIVSLGIFLGIWKLFLLLVTAFSLAAVFAAAGLFAGKFSRKISFPFIPFLAISYVGVMLL